MFKNNSAAFTTSKINEAAKSGVNLADRAGRFVRENRYQLAGLAIWYAACFAAGYAAGDYLIKDAKKAANS